MNDSVRSGNRLEWSIDPREWVVSRGIVQLRFFAFYGLLLLMAGFAVSFFVQSSQLPTALVVVSVSAGGCFLLLLLVRSVDEQNSARIGRYLSIVGSQSETLFSVWRPSYLVALAFVGSLVQYLLWTTAIPPIVLVAVPILVRTLEGVVAALIPFSGAIDSETGVYARLSEKSDDSITYDLTNRTEAGTWNVGNVVFLWYRRADGVLPTYLLVPIPVDQYRELQSCPNQTSSDATNGFSS